MERRLRSSSEGAGGPRIHGNHREAPGMEGCGLLKHRNNSSSSKLGSLVGLKLSVFVCVFIRQQCPLMIMSSVVVHICGKLFFIYVYILHQLVIYFYEVIIHNKAQKCKEKKS